jgi:hypothetical protein
MGWSWFLCGSMCLIEKLVGRWVGVTDQQGVLGVTSFESHQG